MTTLTQLLVDFRGESPGAPTVVNAHACHLAENLIPLPWDRGADCRMRQVVALQSAFREDSGLLLGTLTSSNMR